MSEVGETTRERIYRMIEAIPMDPTVVKSPQEGDEGVHGLSARAKNNAECYKLNFKKIGWL